MWRMQMLMIKALVLLAILGAAKVTFRGDTALSRDSSATRAEHPSRAGGCGGCSCCCR